MSGSTHAKWAVGRGRLRRGRGPRIKGPRAYMGSGNKVQAQGSGRGRGRMRACMSHVAHPVTQ